MGVLINNDTYYGGIYKAILIDYDDELRIYVPCLSSLNIDINNSEDLKKYRYCLSMPNWNAPNLEAQEHETPTHPCWVTFENGNISRPIIMGWVGKGIIYSAGEVGVSNDNYNDNNNDDNNDNNDNNDNSEEFIADSSFPCEISINKPNYKWAGDLEQRNTTTHIFIHHAAGNGSAENIHDGHVNNGWVGIGYHFYIRKDGSVYAGRPINMIGAHTENHNYYSIGVCFEGNYETNDTTMSNEQFNAGQIILKSIKNKYPSITNIKRHSDVASTACPGQYFPFDELINDI